MDAAREQHAAFLEKEIITTVLQSLIDHPDELNVRRFSEPDEMLRFQVHAHRSDIGRILGFGGRNIMALRRICHAYATKNQFQVKIDVIEPDGRGKNK